MRTIFDKLDFFFQTTAPNCQVFLKNGSFFIGKIKSVYRNDQIIKFEIRPPQSSTAIQDLSEIATTAVQKIESAP